MDAEYMRMALDLAVKARGRTSPNPMVGAVIVKDGQVIGRGFHTRAGQPHAEIEALRDAGEKAREATLYVNLEPCCHTGRTGPCTEAILSAGIRRVVIAMRDPNPLVAGKGIARLREHGVEVTENVLYDEARRLNEVFIKYITTRRPFIVLKAAMSLDGKIATRTGESRWITGDEARRYVHELRDRYDCILVGINTVLQDNPSLTTRLPGREGRDPVRIILDSLARTPLDAKVVGNNSTAKTIIAVTGKASASKVQALREAGVEVLTCGDGPQVSLKELMAVLGEQSLTSILVEGGSRVHASFLAQKLVDKVVWFVAPKIIGGERAPGPVGGAGIARMSEAVRLSDMSVRTLGQDICIEGYPVWEKD
ncbi:MAG: bifunctional diaminohydroxyphosphoribosylaminopyrimidine deaminase/5-amino-6-(5-phosphoribosylamino)uracil reductase RibD [Peptococcaceae bacterium]|nr:bifunctional diaminohydroxyphosphoribosylaminopyrimidine deaminase/5-amino-6-(5-phosphoribosylamino)uracil reductase RibD [Peptococcaceae bacterium]